MGRSRTPGTVIVGALLTLTTALLLPTPSQATNPRAAQVTGTLRISDTTVAPGERIAFTGKVPPQRSRTVKLQTFRNGSWAVLATKQTSRRGGFRFSTISPTRAGEHDYRVLAPAATLGGRRYGSVTTPARTLTVVTMVDAAGGWRHNCALGSNGRAWCWGSNEFGELGDGTGGTSDDTPVSGPVRVLGTEWTDISAAGASTCGVRTDHSGWCWGDGATYMFADAGGWVPAPAQLPGDWSQLSAGAFYACGVHTDGTGWCQGQNDEGQLGTAEPVSTTTPVQVPGSWIEIVSGAGFESVTTCGIKANRSAWCWGSGGQGQLGNNGTTSSATPVKVVGGREWASLSVGGAHVCGTTTDGAGWCWGENTDGRVGDGSNLNARRVPFRVTVADTWSSLDAGFQHTCGSTTDGTGWCWGRNDQGQLGNGTHETTYFPVPPPTQLEGAWTRVVAGFNGSVGTQESGFAWAWGEATHGQTGQGPSGLATTPVQVAIAP